VHLKNTTKKGKRKIPGREIAESHPESFALQEQDLRHVARESQDCRNEICSNPPSREKHCFLKGGKYREPRSQSNHHLKSLGGVSMRKEARKFRPRLVSLWREGGGFPGGGKTAENATTFKGVDAKGSQIREAT